MLDIEDRARRFAVAFEVFLAEAGHNASAVDLAGLFESLLLSETRSALIKRWISGADGRFHSLAGEFLSREILAGRLSQFSECLTIALSTWIEGNEGIVQRYAEHESPALQRAAQIASGRLKVVNPNRAVRQKEERILRDEAATNTRRTNRQAALGHLASLAERMVCEFDALQKRLSRHDRFRTSYETVASDFVRRMMRSNPIDDEWLHCEFNHRQLPPTLSKDRKKFLRRATDYVHANLQSTKTGTIRITQAILDVQAEKLWNRVRSRRQKSLGVVSESRHRTTDQLSSRFVRYLVKSTLRKSFTKKDIWQ